MVKLQSNQTKMWQEDVAKDTHQISLAGSYRRALANVLLGIIDKAFCHVIKHVDRNFNLRVYKRGNEAVKTLWLAIFANEELFHIPTEITDFDVGNDGRAEPFAAKFPFSHILFNIVEQLLFEVDSLMSDEYVILNFIFF